MKQKDWGAPHYSQHRPSPLTSDDQLDDFNDDDDDFAHEDFDEDDFAGFDDFANLENLKEFADFKKQFSTQGQGRQPWHDLTQMIPPLPEEASSYQPQLDSDLDDTPESAAASEPQPSMPPSQAELAEPSGHKPELTEVAPATQRLPGKPALDPAAPLINADELSVSVSCEVGRVSLSLQELSQLRLGSQIELMRWPNKVRLLVNQICFAEGYLVEINGMLGVKISSKYT